MPKSSPCYELRIAETDDDIRDAQRLRYTVFVEELGADGANVDHAARLECDAYDPFCDHLILYDRNRPAGDQAVGAYRVMREDQAAAFGNYYTETEFDLTALKTSGRKLLELGRSCVHADYRGGSALSQLWVGLMKYSDALEIDILFGVASFHGTDPDAIALPLSHLHHSHRAPEELRTRVLPAHFTSADRMPADRIDPRAAMREMPPLIRAYLRLNGKIGEGAFIDHAFNTVDVCIIVDLHQVPPKQRATYEKLALREGRG
ncbi:MAG: GNAT family N-acetyltransferase [Maritimibacter harenae]